MVHKMEEELYLNQIPRRKRRFFRNNRILLKALSKHIKKSPDVKEIEKQRIIERLRWQLNMAERSELLRLADVLFEQLNEKEAANIVKRNIKAKKVLKPELSEEDCKEIVENIYEQLRESAKEEKLLRHRERKKQKEVEKIKKALKRAMRSTTGAKEKVRGEKGIERKLRKAEEKKFVPEEEPISESEDILSMLKESTEPAEETAELTGSESEETDVFKELEKLAEEKPKKKKPNR